MTEPVVRETLLRQPLDNKVTAAVEIRRITVQPNVSVGPHRHNGPVFGAVERGSVHFQVDGGPERILRAGDTFYEPAEALIDRFDATEEGVTFLGYFLTGPGEQPVLTAAGPSD